MYEDNGYNCMDWAGMDCEYATGVEVILLMGSW